MPSEVVYISGKQTQWLDYVSSPVVGLAATNTFCAAGLQDGSIHVYSPTGRRYVMLVLAHPDTDSCVMQPDAYYLTGRLVLANLGVQEQLVGVDRDGTAICMVSIVSSSD